jgi:hypothetical protein
MRPRKSFLLRLDPLLYDALERWAGQELRSVNAQIEFLLRRAVSARDENLGERLSGPDSDSDSVSVSDSTASQSDQPPQ